MAKVGRPQFLSSNFPFLTVVQSLENTSGGFGTGFHIGNGFLLTNRHVYSELAGGFTRKTEFKGFEQIKFAKNRDLYLVALPKPSDADTAAMNHHSNLMRRGMFWDQVLNYTDWALVYDPALKNNAKLDQFRNSDTVQPGETLWVLGRPEVGNQGKIAAGSFHSRHGKVSILEDIDLMGGFSGSPVVDSQGRVVGIVFGFADSLRKASMMNIEGILKEIEGVRTAPAEKIQKPAVVPLSSRFVNNGKSETVIFIHGNGDSMESFASIEAHLPQTYNYLFYDQRGHGKSKYDGVDYRLKTMVDDLDSLISNSGLQNIHLVGHSFGARIAMGYAASNPQKVKSVVIEDMDLVGRDPGGEKSVDQYALRFQTLLKTYPSMNDAIHAISLVYGSDNQTLATVLSQVTYRQEAQGGITLLSAPIAPYLWGAYANATDLRGELKSYSGPLLFLRANSNASAMNPIAIAQMKSIKPNLSIIDFPNSSHSIHGSQPADYLKTVLEFISRAK